MKALNLKTFITLAIMIIIVSGVKNTIEMNSSALSNQESLSLKTVDQLTDDMSLANAKGSFRFKRKVTQKKLGKIKVKKSVNSSPRIKRIEQIKTETTSYIQDDLSLELVEFYNPNKYSAIVKTSNTEMNVFGSLEAANGVIESIDVTLPDGENLSVEYGEMNQNRFKYTIDGEPLRGIIYKIDALTYMVSLDEGPYAGTRMKFKNIQDLDTTYEEPVDSKVVEASMAAQKKGFTF